MASVSLATRSTSLGVGKRNSGPRSMNRATSNGRATRSFFGRSRVIQRLMATVIQSDWGMIQLYHAGRGCETDDWKGVGSRDIVTAISDFFPFRDPYALGVHALSGRVFLSRANSSSVLRSQTVR